MFTIIARQTERKRSTTAHLRSRSAAHASHSLPSKLSKRVSPIEPPLPKTLDRQGARSIWCQLIRGLVTDYCMAHTSGFRSGEASTVSCIAKAGLWKTVLARKLANGISFVCITLRLLVGPSCHGLCTEKCRGPRTKCERDTHVSEPSIVET
jgi:hypothetical protein